MSATDAQYASNKAEASKPTGAGIILAPYAGQDVTHGSAEADFSGLERAAAAQEAKVANENAADDRWQMPSIGSGKFPNVMPWLFWLGLGAFSLIILRRPLREIRMGLHLTRMTNIFEEVERTRSTMPIGAGGGIDSLPIARQHQAKAVFERGVAYLKSYPRHEVTRELAKNARLAENLGRTVRFAAIVRLLEVLTQLGIALDTDDFMKSYA